MKVEVTQKGVFMATGKPGSPEQHVEKGAVLDFPGAKTIPGFLVGKCKVVDAEDDGKTLIAGSAAELEALRAEYEKVLGKKAHPDMKPENIQAAIEKAKGQK